MNAPSPSAAALARAGLKNLRVLTLLLALTLAWSFALAPVAIAATSSAPPPTRPAFAMPTPDQIGQMLREDQQRQARQNLVRTEMAAALARSDAALARAAAHSRPRTPSVTLLDENGRLGKAVDPYQAGQWVRELKTMCLPAQRAATLHVWLGEWALAGEEQPEQARWHFAMAERLVPRTDALHGLAAYDTAISLYVGGSYAAANHAFHQLLLPQTALPGYSRPLCALWWRHAAACDGYHQDNARLGIPEPPFLDPLCGAASLAASLRALHRPYDRKTLLASCRVTGEGSSLADLVAAGSGLGVHVRSLAATDQGLMALPKPVVAYVEHDHFISVIRADRAGVAYLCSDCGPWPGGEVDLTWAQWHALSPGVYAAVTVPGSRWDLALDALDPSSGVRLASLPGLAHRLMPSLMPSPRLASLLPALPALRGISLRQLPDNYYTCGGRYVCLQCLPYIYSPTLGGPGAPGLGPGNTPFSPEMASGPSSGDPVNLSTGEEEYAPDSDLTVYNPVGPSVSWWRIYHSLDAQNQNTIVVSPDFGSNWIQPYNITMASEGNGGNLRLANGAIIDFTQPSGNPTAGHPIICPTSAGVPMLVLYNYAAAGNYYSVVFPDRTTWIFLGLMPNSIFKFGYNNVLSQVVDRNGNAITFNYSVIAGLYLLSSITNSAGTTLLTVNRNTNNLITSVADCYGRSVYYQEASYNNYAENGNELTGVSQVVPTGTANAVTNDARSVYGYEAFTNPEGGGDYFLNSITVPSPTGSGTSMASITYGNQDGSYQLVTGLTDGNGNTAAITYLSGTSTKATLSGSGGTSYTGTVTYDSQMDQTSKTDGAGHATSTIGAFSGTDPYRPATVTDGNGHVWSYTWDQYGNELTETPPSSAVRTPATTTNTYVYTNFALGELTKTQTGGKTATSYAYYEPSGLVGTVTGPQPGTAGAAAIVRDAYTYDALGNVTSTAAPGPNSTPAATTGSSGFSTYVTTTMNYTTDGSYSQGDAIGEPLTVTDPLSHITHFRYQESVPYSSTAINRGHTVSTIDALGYETDATFNIDDRSVTTVYPATGQSGSGRGSVDDVYLYDESGDTSGQEQYGPLASVKTYDEGDTSGPLRTVSYTYGLEGEMKGISGSTEPVTYTYDALYRMTGLTDGGGHTTRYFYNTAGYLYQTAYPVSGATTAPLTAGSADTVTDTSYDGNGDLTGREDGNGTTTTYTYNDPENLLTDVHYALPASPPAYISALADTGYVYDAYGRRASMTDATGSHSFSYDDEDTTLSNTTTYTGLSAKTVAYTFDPDGSRATMTLTGVSGGFSYSYDNAGRETGLTNPYGEATSWAYFANNWLQTQTNGYGITATSTYDALGQVTDLKHQQAGSTLDEFTVPTSGGYDGAGNRLSLSANVPATAYTGAVSGTVQDSYDGRDQVVGETSTRSNASYDAPFQYDGVTSGTSTGPGNPTDMRGNSQAFNGDNQITGTGYAYDGDGNPVTYKSNALHFDPEGRMTAYGTAETNTYTGDGLRASRNAGGVNYYLYDGETLLAQLNSDGSLNGVMTFGADGLVSQRSVSGSNSLYYDFDLSGNVSQRWQSVGSVGQSEGFDGFGRRYLATGGDCFTGFTSQWGGYYDSATSGDGGQTGLTLLTHRFYDPSVGRFLTRDPLGYEGGINLYAYTDNNPLNEDDPSGEQAVQGVVVLAGGAYLAGLALYEYLQWLRLHPIIIEPGPGWNPFPKPAPTPPPVSPTSRNINSPRQLGLPTTGQFPYVPPKKWRPGKGLPTDPGGNPIDKNGRPWVKGPNHHFPNESCEWDVQDPDTGKHWNVGGDSGSTK